MHPNFCKRHTYIKERNNALMLVCCYTCHFQVSIHFSNFTQGHIVKSKYMLGMKHVDIFYLYRKLLVYFKCEQIRLWNACWQICWNGYLKYIWAYIYIYIIRSVMFLRTVIKINIECIINTQWMCNDCCCC